MKKICFLKITYSMFNLAYLRAERKGQSYLDDFFQYANFFFNP